MMSESCIYCTVPSTDDVARFLSRYSAWMLGCGATCIRLEKNVSRMAAAYGKSAEITIMPRHVHMTVIDRDDCTRQVTMIASACKTPISFNINTKLSQLSWAIADGRVGFKEAQAHFERIITHDDQSRWLVLLLASVANASFCRLFGGDIWAMVVVFVATMAGYYIKQLLVAQHVDVRIIFFTCAFVSAVLGSTAMLFSLGSTPAIALGTSVLYLIPGIPYLNSFSDMLYGHYICAFSRFMDALVLTGCLSAGLCLAMILMRVGMF